jgi:mRNA interferase HigB
VIARSAIRSFLQRFPEHADAHGPLMAWYRHVHAADWANPAQLKEEARTASILRDGRVVFNVGGNKYRVVAWVNYEHRTVYVRFIGTHRQYDRINAQSI